MNRAVTPNSELPRPAVRSSRGGRTPNSNRWALTLVESVMLFASVLLVIQIGALANQWMWKQAELLSYRSTMQDLTSTIRAMRFRALARQRTFELRIDAARGGLQVVAIQQKRGGYIQTVERTIWLPKGLEITEAPTLVTSLPTGALSTGSILVTAPSYQRAFRVTTDPTGEVRLDEEPTS